MNPTLEYNTKINTGIDELKKQNLIKAKTANSLTMENPKTPNFYVLPKT